MIDSGSQGSLRRRYEAMRRWWCSGEGDAREHQGLAVLLRHGMSLWMREAARVESRDAAVGDPARPTLAGGGCGAGEAILSRPLHTEMARLLATMVIGASGFAKEQNS